MDIKSAQIQIWLALIITVLCWRSVSAHGRQKPVWHEPCSPGAQTSQIDSLFENLGEPDTEVEVARYRHELISELRGARVNARRLERYIKKNRFYSSSHLVRDCQSIPSLLGMPQVEVTHELIHRDVHATLPYDFERLATLAVFVSEISGDGYVSYGYQTRLNSLLDHIRKSMCLTEIVSLSNQQRITRDVTEHVMPTIYTNLPDQALRDMRNCLIARDASQIFDNLYEWYSQWLN